MSFGYSLEPATRGKVLLSTSFGVLEIELWPKECPLATRNFVQLCLEGYYDQCVFHRVVKNFMAQTGDPTGEGSGGESIYGPEGFKNEIHSRLKFNHRGLVAMADSSSTNQSQFFITLDRCDHLDRKHTIFGKVVGNTLFNLLKLNEIDVDELDRPLECPMIVSAEVIDNPFDDIQPRAKSTGAKRPRPGGIQTLPKESTKRRPRIGKHLSLLSFGEEEEEISKSESLLPSQSSAPSIELPPSSVYQDADRKTDTNQQAAPVTKKDPPRLNAQHFLDTPATSSIDGSIAQSSLSESNAAAPAKDGGKRNQKAKEGAELLKQQLEKYKAKKQRVTKPERDKSSLNSFVSFQRSLESKQHISEAEADQWKSGAASDLTASGQDGEEEEDDDDDDDDRGWKSHKLKFRNTGIKSFTEDDRKKDVALTPHEKHLKNFGKLLSKDSRK